VPSRPNPLTPFPAREGGKFGRVLPSLPRRGAKGEVNTPKRWRTLSQRGWAKGGGPGGRSPLAGGCGGCPPTKSKEGVNSPIWKPRHEWGPKRWQTLSPRGWAKGGPGGGAPWRGVVGGVPPQNQKRGSIVPFGNPATSGTQNAGKPSANGGRQTGVEGAAPPPRGLGDVPPGTLKEGASCPH